MRRYRIDCGTIWVCQCCMLSHANGECCPDDEHGGDGVAPWSLIDFDRFAVSMGGDHVAECQRPKVDDCDCERNEFSSARCQGCGSWLHGSRFAFWLTRERQRFSRMPLPA
jgi:hypothetical protein